LGINTGAAHATFPGVNGRIAFDDWATGQTYAINPDGTALAQLTHVNTDQGDWSGDPAWSPDGTHITYEASKGGDVRLWIMDADGAHKHRVTSGRPNTFDLLPVYTPDGQRLVFERFRHLPPSLGGFWQATIQSIAVDGTDRRGLTTTKPPLEVFDFDPSVSPDGKTILFSRSNRNIDGTIRQLFEMGIDGSNQHAVTPPELEAWFPDWSPDGGRIVFTDNSDRVSHSGYVMSAHGSNITRLVGEPFPYSDGQLQYSPDGTQIVFASDRGSSCCKDLFFHVQMFLMNADGTGQTAVDTGTPAPHDFAWGTSAPAPGSSVRTPSAASERQDRMAATCSTSIAFFARCTPPR
jgi:Tol biopolymer transport system component